MQILKGLNKRTLCAYKGFIVALGASLRTFWTTYLLNKSRLLSDICIKQPTPAIAVADRFDTIEYGFTGFNLQAQTKRDCAGA